MYLQQAQVKNYGSLSNRTAVKAGSVSTSDQAHMEQTTDEQTQCLKSTYVFAVYGKPILPNSSATPSPVPFLQGVSKGGEDGLDKHGGKGEGVDNSDGHVIAPPSVDNIPRPLSPTKLTPVGRY